VTAAGEGTPTELDHFFAVSLGMLCVAGTENIAASVLGQEATFFGAPPPAEGEAAA
jgi:hypothetical protein